MKPTDINQYHGVCHKCAENGGGLTVISDAMRPINFSPDAPIPIPDVRVHPDDSPDDLASLRPWNRIET